MNGTILVTGASGALGGQIVEFLAARVPPTRVAALARDAARLAAAAARGVEVRIGDYQDPASLSAALRGVDKLMLVSAPAFTDAITAHRNVIAAARDAGVRHVHFASIQRRPASRFVIDQVTAWNQDAEAQLAASGMASTILRNTLYADALDDIIGEPDADGVIRLPAGHQRAALATRADIAETIAQILAEDGHGDRVYDIAGSHPVTLDEVAAVIATAYHRQVSYQDVAVEEFVDARVRSGQSRPAASFQADWLAAMGAGEFAATGVIEETLGRSPVDPLAFFSQRRS